MYKLKKLCLTISVIVFTFIVNVVPAFALNPDTGDHSNVWLAIGLGGGALVLLIAIIVLGGKKKKR